MEDKFRVILILNIKIDSTHSEDLLVRENDEPEEVAALFCKKHSLSQKVCEILTKNIEENLDAFIEEELENSTTNITSFAESQSRIFDTSQVNHRRAETAKNYGEFLYDKGLQMKQRVEHMVQVQKQNLLEKEMKNLTFAPKINLYNAKTRNASDLCQRKRDLKFKEIFSENPCTFKPQINRTASKDSKGKPDKCLELYKKAEVIKQKIAEKGKKM